jgi:hypothetical protein
MKSTSFWLTSLSFAVTECQRISFRIVKSSKPLGVDGLANALAVAATDVDLPFK